MAAPPLAPRPPHLTLHPRRLLTRAALAAALGGLLLAASSPAIGGPLFSSVDCATLTPGTTAFFCFDQTSQTLREWDGGRWAILSLVNARDFGAIGDGTTDDTNAVIQAVTAAAASHSVVIFPATKSSYRLAGSFDPKGVSFILLGASLTGAGAPTANVVTLDKNGNITTGGTLTAGTLAATSLNFSGVLSASSLTLSTPLGGQNGGTGTANSGFFLGNGVAAPSSPVQGNAFWFNPTLNGLYGYDGTGWKSDAALSMGFVNVKDPRWGAKGDGVTDDAGAIQAVLNAVSDSGSSNSVIYFPPGTYLLKSALSITKAGTTLFGLRGGLSTQGLVTTLKADASFPGATAMVTINIAAGNKGAMLRHLRLDGNGVAAVGVQLATNTIGRTDLYDLSIQNVTTAVQAVGTNYETIALEHIVATTGITTGFDFTGTNIRNVVIDKCQISAATRALFDGENTNTAANRNDHLVVSESDLTVTGAGAQDVMTIRNARNVVIRDNWIEVSSSVTAANAAIVLGTTTPSTPTSVTISGNRIEGNAVTNYAVDLRNVASPRIVSNDVLDMKIADFLPVTVTGGAELAFNSNNSFYELSEIADPPAPATAWGRFYLRASSGVAQLAAEFATGAIIPIATEGTSPGFVAGSTTSFSLAQATTCYTSPFGATCSGTEATSTGVVPATSTIKNLYVVTPGVAVANGQTLTVTLRKNTAATTLTCTITGNVGGTNITCNDTTHTVSVVAGDQIGFQFVSSATAGTTTPIASVQGAIP